MSIAADVLRRKIADKKASLTEYATAMGKLKHEHDVLLALAAEDEEAIAELEGKLRELGEERGQVSGIVVATGGGILPAIVGKPIATVDLDDEPQNYTDADFQEPVVQPGSKPISAIEPPQLMLNQFTILASHGQGGIGGMFEPLSTRQIEYEALETQHAIHGGVSVQAGGEV